MAEVRQAALVAAKWWQDKIANPNMGSYCDGDSTSRGSSITMMTLCMYANEHAASEEQLNEFCTLLSSRIDEELNNSNSTLYLNCEYGPCAILGDIADLLKIDIHLFPFKRSMWITENSVKVKDGCEARVETIYFIGQKSNNSELKT